MQSAAIWTGRILIIIGIVGYAYGFYGGRASFTAMIPAFFGIVITALGHLAKIKESVSKHAMHIAILVGLLGFLLPLGRLAMKFGEIELSAAYVSQIAMALVCLVFVLLGVRSFVAARSS
ncbi:MAG TPA: hypothetical protein VMM38_09905 [Aridibacter sp.]|nr:hypothetical protein [Aridibacter sp.]